MSNFVQLEINEKNRWIYFSKYRWVAHVGYWIWVLCIGTIMRAKGQVTFSLILNHFFLENLMIASFFYLYCLVLIPYLFKRNRYLLFWLAVVSGYFTITAIDVFFNKAFVTLTDPKPMYPNEGFLSHYLINLSGYILNFFLFAIMLYFMEKNEENDTLLELEKEKKAIELVKLDLLKTNVSPDFLLRSLKQLKQAAKVPETYTPEAILTFSDLLRYRLYRGRQSHAPLTEEIDALRSFIHFISFDHHHNQLVVELNTQGDIRDRFIAPLALINLLEPFCKFLPERPAVLEIILLVESDELLVEMDYNAGVPDQLVEDLEAYGDNYTKLYGDTVKFHFENCENQSCTISLSLPLSHI